MSTNFDLDAEAPYDAQGNVLPVQGFYSGSIFYSKEQAAQHLGVSAGTLDKMLSDGRLAHVKVAGGRSGRVLIPRVALVELADSAFADPDFSQPIPGEVSEFSDVSEHVPGIGRVHQSQRPAAEAWLAALREGKSRREAARIARAYQR